ncbi:MAG: hypothetical protein R3330_01145 [Saprospiraceae bacterium]|nr:hypothetical protein [Saprospiraceae bacterium]
MPHYDCKDPFDPRIISTCTLRKLIGCIGILLPLSLGVGGFVVGGCNEIQSSVSDYYHVRIMGDVFVGLLFAVAVFLITYRGYDRDHLWSRLAGIAAFCVALFPTCVDANPPCIAAGVPESTTSTIHFVSAAVFIGVLTYFSLFLFRKSDDPQPPPQKRRRNSVFLWCGMIMLLCLILLVVYFAFLEQRMSIQHLKPVFWLETIALAAFGVSWLTKGQLIFADA